MAEAVYILCAFTSVVCAYLLLKAYKRSKTALLLWSSLCFIAFGLNNIFLVIDLMIIPDIDFLPVRSFMMVGGFLLLLYGLIWERA